MRKVIGLTGTIASGKGTLAEFLKGKGYTYFSLSDTIRDKATKQGLEHTRENLQNLGNRLRAEHGNGILAKLMADKIENLEGNVVIDSIRNPEEVDILRTIPNFILIAIDAHQKLRHKRASKRSREGDPISTEEFRSLDAIDIDIGIHDCIDKSDHIIYNVRKSLDGLKKELEKFVDTEKRPSKDEYYLNIAMAVAKRSTCIRLKTGTIIVNNDQIISTGYNGAPRGTPNCIDLGFCARIKHNIPSGTRYEFCRSVHSEENAMLHSTREQMIGGIMYVAGYNQKNQLVKVLPCMLCQRKVMNAGIKRIVSFDENGIYEQYVEDWIEEAKKDPLKHLEHPEYTSQPKPLKTN